MLQSLLHQKWSSHTMSSGQCYTHDTEEKIIYQKSASKKKGPATTTSMSNASRCALKTFSLFNILAFTTTSLIDVLAFHTRSVTGSNDPPPLQVEHPAPSHTVHTPRKKCAIKKKLTPKRAPLDVTSPASNTRSMKKLKLD